MNTSLFFTADQEPLRAKPQEAQEAQWRAEIGMDRFGLKVAAHLSAGTDQLEHDFSERLRVARQQALAKRKLPALTRATTVVGNGPMAVLTAGGDEPGLWNRLASFLPLVVLVVGLISISTFQNDFRAQEIAEIDAALLTDELPPAAFADPGFAEFVKAKRAAAQ